MNISYPLSFLKVQHQHYSQAMRYMPLCAQEPELSRTEKTKTVRKNEEKGKQINK